MRYYSIVIFPSLILIRNAIMLQHFIIQCLLYYLSSGRLREVKNKRQFQTFSGRLQQVPYIVIWLGDFWYFEKLIAEESWSFTRGGRSRRKKKQQQMPKRQRH